AYGPLLGVVPLVSACSGAVPIGYWIAYLMLFQHEGAHYNLAPARSVNDRLCDCLISRIIGTSVDQYRVVHFEHHRAFGTIEDTERTYFSSLNLSFIVRSLFGVRAFEVMRHRRKVGQTAVGALQERKKDRPVPSRNLAPVFTGFLVHLAILSASL